MAIGIGSQQVSKGKEREAEELQGAQRRLANMESASSCWEGLTRNSESASIGLSFYRTSIFIFLNQLILLSFLGPSNNPYGRGSCPHLVILIMKWIRWQGR
jgi:hypothetical protein